MIQIPSNFAPTGLVERPSLSGSPYTINVDGLGLPKAPSGAVISNIGPSDTAIVYVILPGSTEPKGIPLLKGDSILLSNGQQINQCNINYPDYSGDSQDITITYLQSA